MDDVNACDQRNMDWLAIGSKLKRDSGWFVLEVNMHLQVASLIGRVPHRASADSS
jgi:hypothetical protein